MKIFLIISISLMPFLALAIDKKDFSKTIYDNCVKKSTEKIDMNTTANYCKCYSEGAVIAMLETSDKELDRQFSIISNACKLKYVDGKSR